MAGTTLIGCLCSRQWANLVHEINSFQVSSFAVIAGCGLRRFWWIDKSMSLCSTSQTLQVLHASHSFGLFLVLSGCATGGCVVSPPLHAAQLTGPARGSPRWPDGCRRGWRREEPELLKGRVIFWDLMLKGTSLGAVVPSRSRRCGHLFLYDKMCSGVLGQWFPPCCLCTHPVQAVSHSARVNLGGPFWCTMNLFHPFLRAETFFSKN